jgi:hypothetical protein
VVSRDLATKIVMPALVAGIHAKQRATKLDIMRNGAAWMAGTSPAKTS